MFKPGWAAQQHDVSLQSAGVETYADPYTMSGAYVAPFGEVTLAGLRACSSKDVKPVGCQ